MQRMKRRHTTSLGGVVEHGTAGKGARGRGAGVLSREGAEELGVLFLESLGVESLRLA